MCKCFHHGLSGRPVAALLYTINSDQFIIGVLQEQADAAAGSQVTLTSRKELSHHSGSYGGSADDEQSLGDDVIKDCNGRIVPRLAIVPVSSESEVSVTSPC